jgi:tricarballylate dehydrogenase
MSASADSYDFIVVGCGAAGLSAAVNYIETAKQQGRAPRVAVLESAPKEQRGGATRWTTARFRAREDFSLDPLFEGIVRPGILPRVGTRRRARSHAGGRR